MEDRKILFLLCNRAETAIDALQKKFGGLVYRICMNILQQPQDAEECTNDTYLAVWNAVPPATPDPLTPYVCRTGRNVALNRLRANAAQKRDGGYSLSIDELAECIPDTCLEERVTARALGKAIDEFLTMQTRENRVLFLRRYWFGDGVADAAKAVGISANTGAVRLHRMREKLRQYLTERELYYE